jgi:hypothetical protein
MRRTRRQIVLGLAALAAALAASAASIPSPIGTSRSAAIAEKRAVAGQESLELDVAALSTLRQASGPVTLENFPIAPSMTGTLVLERFEVAAPGSRLTVEGPDGPASLPLPRVDHFRGTLEGQSESRIYVGVQADGLVAYLQTAAGIVTIGPDESGALVLRSADSPANVEYAAASWSCATEGLPLPSGRPDQIDALSYQSVLAPAVAAKQGAVRVDTDQELLAKFGGSTTAMANWILSLFGSINVAYERDLALHLTVVEIHAWTVPDPYDGPATTDQLDQLGTWWQTNRPIASFPRWTVHLLSGRPVSGGVAWLDVSCGWSSNYGYGVTQVNGNYSSNPWDLYASAHEIGHNAGSPHTHCMGPPTYPDWTDECYNGEGGCYSGTVQNPGAGNGTIMSYCHLLGWQYVSLKFHPRCINDQMLPLIAGNTACMVTAGSFADVPPSSSFFDYVQAVSARGITSGCGGTNYCPDASITRAQMAVFLLKAKLGSAYTPPAATGTVFGDVAAGDFAAAWIEQLASLGIATGCGGGNYCPNDPVTRKQMAPFLLKTLLGSGHVPPAASSLFSDVAGADPFEPWIMELYTRSITGGCATGPLRYCPDGPNTRGQMAVFLVKTFGLLTTVN